MVAAKGAIRMIDTNSKTTDLDSSTSSRTAQPTNKTRMGAYGGSSSSSSMTMVECLDCDDPIMALRAIASSTANQIVQQSTELRAALTGENSTSNISTSGTIDGTSKITPPSWQVPLPPLLTRDSIEQFMNDNSNSNGNSGFSTAPTSVGMHDDYHPLRTVSACAESIVSNLEKISTGGLEASQQVRKLELKKRTLDHHAAVILASVSLRQQSSRAAQAYASESWHDCAEALRPWLLWTQQQSKQRKKNDPDNTHDIIDANASNDPSNVMNDRRVAIYTGEYSLQQLSTTYDKLKQTLLSLYETAVQASNLQALGQLTPILTTMQLEYDGLRLYKVYLQSVLERTMKDAIEQQASSQQQSTAKSTKASTAITPSPPYMTMGRVYNVAVSALRHHLPMVSHCLHRANGDVSIVQLVHMQTEHVVIPIVQQQYHNKNDFRRQFYKIAQTAAQLYSVIEDRYTGRGGMVDHNNMSDNNDNTTQLYDDCGFTKQIGTLVDVDVTMEEVAMCIQHTESYMRFVQHTCTEVNRARKLRHEQQMKQRRLDRERYEWTKSSADSNKQLSPMHTGDQSKMFDDDDDIYKEIEILSPNSTPLHECIAELGGQYAAIERCLLIASIQRAVEYTYSDIDDAKLYRPMSTLSNMNKSTSSASGTSHGASSSSVDAWQTMLVETIWYVARRCTQRAFATGHTGTASAVTNFVVECFTDVCVPILVHRAEEYGIYPLKPGEGLLVGSINIFNNASNLIRQGAAGGTAAVVSGLQLPSTAGSTGTTKHKTYHDEIIRKQKIEEKIIHACAMINDIEVAIHHTQQLEGILNKSIDKGFTPNTHETEQLRMCVKAFGSVADTFQYTSTSIIESFESVLKPRIRSIVSDSIGSTDSTSTTATFMGAVTTSTNVLGGGGKSNDPYHRGSDMIRLNYDLDEEAYNLLQLSESYVSRLCTLLDELLIPIKRHLAPRLWDMLLLHVISTVCKRLEVSLRKCDYTALGGITFDSDIRDLLSYTKDHLCSAEYYSNTNAIIKACPALSKLLQLAKLLCVDDLDDVIDLIVSSKRKGNWDIKIDDAKTFLSLRVEFDNDKVNELLRLPDDE